MAVNKVLTITRSQLKKIIGDDPKAIKQFEQIFNTSNDTVTQINGLQVQIDVIDDRLDIIDDQIYDLQQPLMNVITVAKEYGDYDNIKDALDSITDNTPSNRYTIEVAPGVYEIDNSLGALQLKSFCNISAIGIRSVVFTPKEPSADMFLGNNFTHLIGIVFSGNIGSSYIVRHEESGSVFIQDCVLRDCINGFLLNGSSSVFEIRVLAVNNPLSTTTNTAIEVTAGSATFSDIIFRSTSKITTGFKISGSNSIVNMHKLIAFSSNVTTAIEVFDGAVLSGVAVDVLGANDAIVVYGDNTTVELDAVKIQQCQNDGLRVEDTGTDQRVSVFDGTFIDCDNYNFNIESETATILGSGFTQVNKGYISQGANFHAYFLDITEDDEGLNVYGELHVGTPTRPTESALGGGDSYTAGMLVYTENTSNVFVDVSEEARSASGSAFTFTGTAADNAIYIASSLANSSDVLEHYGIKTKVNTAAVSGAGSIIFEYWNGSSWVLLEGMEVDSGGGYYPHANNYFQDSGSHHIRYNEELAADSWTKNDPMSLGVDYYWVRIRIDSAITTAPIFEQFKLHTNRTEINEDGWVEYFGNARPIGQLPFTVGGDRAFSGNLGNQTLYINEDIGAGLIENDFNGTNDKIGRFFFAPLDLDTSSPIELKIAGRASGNGTVGFTIRWDKATDGDTAYTSNPSLVPGAREVSESKTVVSGEITIFTFKLDVSNVVARRESGEPDFIGLSIHSDTLSGSAFEMIALEATYVKWCEGGHVR